METMICDDFVRVIQESKPRNKLVVILDNK